MINVTTDRSFRLYLVLPNSTERRVSVGIPFIVGGSYRNRDGVYEVVDLTPPTMLIRYRDGRELKTLIADQARIWENMQIEADDPDATDDDIEDLPRRGRAGPAFRPIKTITKPLFDFRGLADSDFKSSPAGTHWRSRGSLGGLLANQLSTRSGRKFESHAVSRRCEVQIHDPQRFNHPEPLREAKFRFAVNESGVLHGFYIEKNDGPMDATWDWTRFNAALRRDPSLCTRLAPSLTDHDLRWDVETGIAGQDNWVATQVTATSGGQAQWRSGNDAPQTIPWTEFIERLQTLPADQWCNLMVCQSLTRSRAIGLRAGLADHAVRVWHLLLPLYMASVTNG
jgi:hypothetical protein